MKKYIWIIAIIALIIMGVIMFSMNKDGKEEGQKQINMEEPIQDYVNLQSDEDVFNAIDESLAFLD